MKVLLKISAAIDAVNEKFGFIANYFVLFADVSPISISWAKADDFQSFFSIVFRFKLRQNLAVLPIPSDGR